MARKIKNPKIIVAISPAAACEALGIVWRDLDPHIKSGTLPVYTCGIRRRVLISDLEALVRTWPRHTPRQPKRKVPNDKVQ